MTTNSDEQLELTIDDEHPLFDAILSHARAGRDNVVKQPPELPPLSISLVGVGQLYHLEHVAELRWSNARAVMRTRWRPTGKPTTVTAATEEETKK